MMNREAIYQALYAKLAAVPGLKTKGRKLKHWTDVPASQQPALFQAQKNELAQRQQGLGTVWTLTVDVYLYTHTAGIALPSAQLNGIVDAIEAALQPDNPVRNTNTLGGLVQHCRIEGAIETDEGTLGDQAVCIIPIVITAT